MNLSYKPPAKADVVGSLDGSGFKLLDSKVWKFKKSLEELGQFYMIPGFGTKSFRELADEKLKRSIIDEIITGLESQGVNEINFRWAEFVTQRA